MYLEKLKIGKEMKGIVFKTPDLVSVDYDLSITKIIETGYGYYKNIENELLSCDFQTNFKGKADIYIEMIKLDQNVSEDVLIYDIDQLDCRPAEVHEFFAFNKCYPNTHERFNLPFSIGAVCVSKKGVRFIVWIETTPKGCGIRHSIQIRRFGDGPIHSSYLLLVHK